MSKPSFSDYSDVFILLQGNVAIVATETDVVARPTDAIYKQVAFKNLLNLMIV